MILTIAIIFIIIIAVCCALCGITVVIDGITLGEYDLPTVIQDWALGIGALATAGLLGCFIAGLVQIIGILM